MFRDYTPKTAGLALIVSAMACGGDAEQRTAVPLDSNVVCYAELSPSVKKFSHPYQLMESKEGKFVVTANEIPNQVFHSDSVRLTFASLETDDDTLPEALVCYDGEGYPHWSPLKRVKFWEYYGLAYDSGGERSLNGP